MKQRILIAILMYREIMVRLILEDSQQTYNNSDIDKIAVILLVEIYSIEALV